MLLIKVEDNIPTNAVNDVAKIQLNELYMVSGFHRSIYRGTENTYFTESRNPKSSMFIMTKEDGTKPFAVATNDCRRDNFEPFGLATILVYPNSYVIYAYRNKEDNILNPINFVAFQVVDPNYNIETVSSGESVLCKVAYIFNSISDVPKIFEPVVEHVNRVIDSDFNDQLVPKYCFNPNRFVTLRMFMTDDNDDVTSFTEDGKHLLLNANSLEHSGLNNKITKGGLFRVFFSRKFKDSQTIFVDGVHLEVLKRYDLEDYVENTQMNTEFAKNVLKTITLSNGLKFYASVTVTGEIRPIYKSINGFSSFALNEHEGEMIESVKDVDEWL